MFPYVFLILFIFLASFIEKTKYSFNVGSKYFDGRFIYCFVVMGFLSLFMGLRSINVGCDLKQYFYRYEISSILINRNVERGYNYLNFFFHDILHSPFQLFLFFTVCITCLSLFFVFFRYSQDITFSLLLYITIGMFTMAFSGIRQTLAMSIVWLSIYFIEKRKMVLFVAMVLLASTFHNSALIFFVAYPLWGVCLTKKQCRLIIITTLSMFFLRVLLTPLIRFLAPSKYAGMSLFENYHVNPLVFLVAISIMFFCYFFQKYDDKQKCNEQDSFFFVFSCFNVLFLILSMSNNQLGRLSYYFNIGYCVLIPSVIKYQESYGRLSSLIIKFIVIGFALAYFFISTPGGTLKIDNYSLFFI